MSERDDYKPTMFDRHGPEAALFMYGVVYGSICFLMVLFALMMKTGFHWWTLPAAIVAGLSGGGGGIWISNAGGNTYKSLMVNGASTPYVEQYSYQQALVMQGKLDEALESFEAVIAEKPDAVDPRVKAAELYDREKKNFARAAELFREVTRIESVTPGQYVYAAHRLVDLYTSRLNEPGRALVELRRLIDRYPGSPAAEKARAGLATLKERHHTPSEQH